MKTLRHYLILLFISIISSLLINCEKVDPKMEMLDDPTLELNTAALKATPTDATAEINYLLGLIETIESLLEEGLLNRGNANALIVKIQNAINSIERGNSNAASGQLGAFTSQVEDFVENGVIPEDIGEDLINTAEIVINQVNGMTYVPDDNFEQALIDLGYDQSPLDDYVPTANIDTATSLLVIYYDIHDLTGIESFTSLTFLGCGRNPLISLDVSNNTALTMLFCSETQISSLDVSNNTGLTILGCYANQLSSLDVSNNIALEHLYCSDNQLSSLDVSNNPALISLRCQYNPSLYCIQVESITELPDNYQIDPHTSFSEDCGSQPVNTFTDPRDGITYITVQIGDQVWMAENLKYLPEVSPPSEGSLSSPHYYVYDYYGTDVAAAKATANYTSYGVLYNWVAAMGGSATSNAIPSGVQGVCPDGWHLPSLAEWTILSEYLIDNGYGFEGSGNDIAKSLAAQTNWTTTPDIGTVGNDLASNNSSFFSGLPGGYCQNSTSEFFGIGYLALWWSTFEHSTPSLAWSTSLSSYSLDFTAIGANDKTNGFNIRCIKD